MKFETYGTKNQEVLLIESGANEVRAKREPSSFYERSE